MQSNTLDDLLTVNDDADRAAGSNCAMTALGLLAACVAVVFGAVYVLAHIIAAAVS